MDLASVMIYKNSEFGSVRTIEENGNILFCARDVAVALGYKNPGKAIHDYCKFVARIGGKAPLDVGSHNDGETGILKHGPISTNGGQQEAAYITEGDLYRLITHSRLPAAQKFERWVFDEVIPTIRRQGYYAVAGAGTAQPNPLPNGSQFHADEGNFQIRKSWVNCTLAILEKALGLTKNEMLHQTYQGMKDNAWISVDDMRQRYMESGGDPAVSALDVILRDKDAYRELYNILEYNMELATVKHFR